MKSKVMRMLKKKQRCDSQLKTKQLKTNHTGQALAFFFKLERASNNKKKVR